MPDTVIGGKTMKRIILFPIILLIFFSPLSLLADWEDYKPNKISQMITLYTEFKKDLNYFYTPGVPFTTTVTYLGEIRKIIPERSNYIEMWVKTYNMDPGSAKLFDQEILIEEDGKKYWLPIQYVLIPYLKKEVNVNENVILYIRLVGAINNDWVFFVNEFRTLQMKEGDNNTDLTRKISPDILRNTFSI
jgi:hypothetical protein